MKVLLVSDIKKLGWLGEVVEVSEGYARNYLLPQGLAVVPTEANLKSIARQKAERMEKRVLERKKLEEVAKAVEGAEVVIGAAANDLGHLFGSVGASEIAANLRSQGFEVADDAVDLPGHIKQVGTTKVSLLFDKDLSAKVLVIVVAEPAGGGASPNGGQEAENGSSNRTTSEPR